MSTRHVPLFAILSLTLLATLAAAPASGQQVFEAEVSCGGTHAPGSTIELSFRIENQSLETLQLQVSAAVLVPGLGEFPILSGNISVGPNQNRSAVKMLRIPGSAPNGSYTVRFVADSGETMTFDTCSFKVE